MRFGSAATALLEIFLRVVPIRFAETLCPPRKFFAIMRVKPFSRMTSAFHTPMTCSAPECFGFELERLERLLAHLARVLDPSRVPMRQRVASDRARQLEMSLGVVRICRDGAPRVLFCASCTTRRAARRSG